MTAELTVNVPQALMTKAVAETDGEKKVNSLQVYVFDKAGSHLESYGKASAASLTLSVTVGDKLVAALVNSADITDVTSLAALKAKTVSLGDNKATSFIMFGTQSAAVAGASTVTVKVSRLVARVTISKITNSLSAPQYASTPISITGIYLVNAGAVTNLGSTYALTANDYQNKMKKDASSAALLNLTPSASVAHGGSYSTESRLYCCPNPATTDSSSSTWSARYTRLVVETKIGDTIYYYPITIKGPIQANYSYEIPELTITRLGSASPDTPIQIGDATFTVTVNPWTVSTQESVTI